MSQLQLDLKCKPVDIENLSKIKPEREQKLIPKESLNTIAKLLMNGGILPKLKPSKAQEIVYNYVLSRSKSYVSSRTEFLRNWEYEKDYLLRQVAAEAEEIENDGTGLGGKSCSQEQEENKINDDSNLDIKNEPTHSSEWNQILDFSYSSRKNKFKLHHKTDSEIIKQIKNIGKKQDSIRA